MHSSSLNTFALRDPSATTPVVLRMELLIPRELFSCTYEDRQRLEVGLWRIMVTKFGILLLVLAGTIVPQGAYVRI